MNRPDRSPTNDTAGEGLNNESDIDEAPPNCHMVKARQPQHIPPWLMELAIDEIERTGGSPGAHRRLDRFASNRSLHPFCPHQTDLDHHVSVRASLGRPFGRILTQGEVSVVDRLGDLQQTASSLAPWG